MKRYSLRSQLHSEKDLDARLRRVFDQPSTFDSGVIAYLTREEIVERDVRELTS